MRAYLRIGRGAKAADAALARVRTRVLCAQCQTWGEDACACGRGRVSGPYELGPLADAEWIRRLEDANQRSTLAQPKRVARLLALARAEAALGPFYADLSELARITKKGPPSPDAVIAALEAHGVRAARTHFAPNAVAYAGEPAEMMRVVRELRTR
jgi:tRNA G26 N,N-dimethylase Trm1